MNKKQLTPYNTNFEEDSEGQVFIAPSGEIMDYTEFTILDTSIDTVRQLYNGKLKEDWMEYLNDRLENEHNPVVEYQGHMWSLRRGGKAGFKYLLQNASFGVVILLKSNYVSVEQQGTHCKIELSPKLVRDQSPDVTQAMMDELASSFFALAPNPSGVAIHIATDFMGWEPPVDFSQNLTCRSQRINDRNGINELAITTGEVCSVYGRGQSYTYGTVGSLQAALYNKSIEIYRHDKADHFEDIWRRKVDPDTLEPLWNPDKTVRRLEMRFSQTVIRQFADFNHLHLMTFESVVPYLQNLWNYALDRFRFDLDKTYVHPIWSLLERARFCAPAADFIAKRQYKRPGIGNERNVSLALGNLLSIYARNHMTARQAWRCLKKSGMWCDLTSYIQARGLTKADLFEAIRQGLLDRSLTSKVAA